MKKTTTGAVALAFALALGGLVGCAANDEAQLPDTGEDAAATEQVEEAIPEESAEVEETDEATEEAEPVHEHLWQRDYALETTEAVTETIHHDAVTETVNEYHTLCNVCFEVIDGNVECHAAETGHVGATPDVQVPVEVTVQDERDEVKIITPEETHLVSRSRTCSVCGAREEIEEQVIDPADAVVPDAGTAGSGAL